MNTAITYLYRDGSNFKYTHSVTVEGGLSYADLEPFLDEGEYFCPKDVGFPHPGEMAEGWPNDDDHVWCELREDSFEPTDLRPSDMKGTAAAVIERFRTAHEAGWPAQKEGV